MRRAEYERRARRRARALFGTGLLLASSCRLGSRPEPPFEPAEGQSGGPAGSGALGTGGTTGQAGGPDTGAAGQAASGGVPGEAGPDAQGSGGTLQDTGTAGGAAGNEAGGDSADSSDASDGTQDAGDASADAGDASADTGGDPDAGCPPSWVVTYRLHGEPPPGPPAPFDRTLFAVRGEGFSVTVGDHTDNGWQCTAGGQDCLGVGPGRLKIRYRDSEGRPADGKVTLVAYENAYAFRLSFIDSFLTVDADGLLPPSPPSTLQPNHPAPVCEAAVGSLSDKRVTWTTPAVDHRTHGTLVCNTTQSFCSLAGLNVGTNTRDDTYAVELKPFLFTLAPADDQGGELYLDEGPNPQPTSAGIEIPTPNPSVQGRAFILLKGVEIGRALEASPACFCE